MAESYIRKDNLWITLIELCGLLFITNFARFCITYIFEYFQDSESLKFIQLFLTYSIPVLIVLLYIKYGEKRETSLTKLMGPKPLKAYIAGALIGVLLIIIIAGLSLAFGEIEFRGINKSVALLPFGATFFLSIINIREEFIFRGWLLTTPYSINNPIKASFMGSVVFGLIHYGNTNVTLLSIMNLVLLGLLLSEIFLIFKNIYLVAAIHTMWNFTQGKILGLPISGHQTNSALLDFSIEQNSLTEGFGLEGNIFTTIILILAIAIATRKIVYLQQQKWELTQNN